jgi:pilus assembly protein CpaF
VVPTVAASVDLVVHLGLEANGQRRVREIVGVTGRVEGEVIETSDIFTSRGTRLERAEGYPPHPERFDVVGIELAELLREPGARPMHAVGEA